LNHLLEAAPWTSPAIAAKKRFLRKKKKIKTECRKKEMGIAAFLHARGDSRAPGENASEFTGGGEAAPTANVSSAGVQREFL